MTRVVNYEVLDTILAFREDKAISVVMDDLRDNPELINGHKCTITAFLHEASVKSEDQVSDIMVRVDRVDDQPITYRVAVDKFGENAFIKNHSCIGGDLRHLDEIDNHDVEILLAPYRNRKDVEMEGKDV